jgi:hypothetical protein
VDPDLLARGDPAQRVRRYVQELQVHVARRRRAVAVDVCAEEIQDLRPPVPRPGGRVPHRRADVQHQGVGQRVLGNLGLVIIRRPALRRRRQGRRREGHQHQQATQFHGDISSHIVPQS